MPTPPLTPLLDRARSKAEASALVRIVDPLLEELVNYATHVFDRCQSSATGGQDEELGPLILYLDVVEMTDGVHTMIKDVCAGAAIPVLRSLFEAELYLDFLLSKKDPERSLAWLVDYATTRIDRLQRYDPIKKSETKRRKKKGLLGPTKKERELSALIRMEIKGLQNFLGQPHIVPVKAKIGRASRWYQPYGGGATLEQLANTLGRGDEYQKLYRYWSAVSHAGDLSRFLSVTSADAPAFQPLRDPTQVAEIASIASMIILRATRRMIARYRPTETRSLQEWYRREIRSLHMAVASAVPLA